MARDEQNRVEYNRMYREERTNSHNPRGLRQSIDTPKRHVYGGKVPVFATCIHIWGRTGCQCTNEPEENSQYCRGCRDFLITLTDRVTSTPAQTKHVDWRFEGATRRNRRKKAA